MGGSEHGVSRAEAPSPCHPSRADLRACVPVTSQVPMLLGKESGARCRPFLAGRLTLGTWGMTRGVSPGDGIGKWADAAEGQGVC